MSTTKVQGDMIDVDGATVAVVAAGDKFNFLDITDSLVKEDTVQGILDLAGGGNWEFISVTTASTASTVDLAENNIDAGYDYLIIGQNIDGSADQNLGLRLGNGGTPTYPTSGYKADHVRNSGWDAWESATNAITAGIVFWSTGGGATADEDSNWDCLIYNPGATTKTTAVIVGQMTDNGNNNCFFNAWGRDDTARATTGFRIFPDTGTFSGQVILLRRKVTA